MTNQTAKDLRFLINDFAQTQGIGRYDERGHSKTENIGTEAIKFRKCGIRIKTTLVDTHSTRFEEVMDSDPRKRKLTPRPNTQSVKANGKDRGDIQVRKGEQEGINAWLKQNISADTPAVFFTLKFHRRAFLEVGGRQSITEKKATSILNRWLNRLDRTQGTKREVKRGKRIDRVVFKHGGYTGENIHFHGVVLATHNANKLLKDCQRFWLELVGDGWVDASRSKIEIATDIEATAHYSAHEVWKLGAEDSWCIWQTHMPNDGLAISKKEQEKIAVKTANLKKLRMIMGTINTYLHLWEEINRGNDKPPKDDDWAVKLSLLLLLEAETRQQT